MYEYYTSVCVRYDVMNTKFVTFPHDGGFFPINLNTLKKSLEYLEVLYSM